MYTLSRRLYIRSMPFIALIARIFNRDIYARLYGRKVYYDPRTDVGDKILRVGNFERAELSIIGKLLTETSVVLDIGANIGTHSLFMANIATKGKIFSFEPARDTYRFLAKNTNGVANIQTLNVGASDKSGTATFHVAIDNAYSGIDDTGKKPILRTESITTVSVDDFVNTYKPDKIDLIKIDVEGHEEQVLRGAAKTLQSYKPFLLVEICEGKGSTADAEKTIGSVARLGYDVYVIKGWDVTPFVKHDNEYQNYLFLPKGKAVPK